MIRLFHKGFRLFGQPGKFVLDNSPDDLGVYLCVLIDDPVAEADALARRTDGSLELREVACGLADGFAHYRELPLDGPPEHPVLFEVREAAVLNATQDGPARIGDVPQIGFTTTPRYTGFLG